MNIYVCIRAQGLKGLPEEQIFRFDNGVTLVKSPTPLKRKGLICVTDNPFFNGETPTAQVKHAVLEGTDGVGKTSTIEGLIAQGILCFDRDPIICQYMLFDVDMKIRCEAYEKYLRTCGHTVVFLVNNSKEELERRVYSRGNVSQFDKDTYAYNELYRRTFEEMGNYQTFGKLKLVDCTGLSFVDQIEKVKQSL